MIDLRHLAGRQGASELASRTVSSNPAQPAFDRCTAVRQLLRPRELDQQHNACGPGSSGPHTDCRPACHPDRAFAYAKHIYGQPLLCMHPMFWLGLGCMRMLVVRQIPSGRAGVRQGEYRSSLPFRLQRAQGMTGIGLVAEAIAVAGSCLPVHPAKIVERQEAACVDRYPHVLSVDFR
jgi:hypothetical protein